MKKQHIAAAFVIVALFTGCAGTKITTTYKEAGNEIKVKGYLTYQAELYLWVMADSSGKNLTYKFIPLPDRNKKVVITPKRGFGSGETNFKVTDGWLLTEFGSKSDSKVPETITGVAGLVTAGAGFLAPVAEKSAVEEATEIVNDKNIEKSNKSVEGAESEDELFKKAFKKWFEKRTPQSVAGLYKINYDSETNLITGFTRVNGYPLPHPIPAKEPCTGCSCDYDGKKYSEDAVIEMPGKDDKSKLRKKCTRGIWVDVTP